jgi:hypothetical protein
MLGDILTFKQDDIREEDIMPHCDTRILHAPGECQYCDGRPDLQKARERMGINFTGHKEEGKGPCPADSIRGDTHTEWGGNRARPYHDVTKSFLITMDGGYSSDILSATAVLTALKVYFGEIKFEVKENT